MALKGKQALFVEEYLKTFNATEAAKTAGYSPKTAYSIGWENLRKPEIAQAISRRLSESAMTSDEVLMRLADQARGDMGIFLAKEGDRLTIDLVGMKAAGKAHLIKRITQTTRRRTTKDATEEEATTSLELYDAQAALVQIGKHHKLFTDKLEVENNGPIPIMIVQPGQLDKLKP